MIGYQADLGDGWWGCLYDESRRNKVLAGPPDDQRAKLVKRDDWNEYRIRCQGRKIELWINGQQTVDYTEPDEKIEQVGLIGLQIHGGPPSEAWYKRHPDQGTQVELRSGDQREAQGDRDWHSRRSAGNVQIVRGQAVSRDRFDAPRHVDRLVVEVVRCRT